MNVINSDLLNTSISAPPSPQITLITATYNAENYLNDCILSVLNQTYTNFEYIIIDGNSTDGTTDIIRRYQHKIAYWVSETDQGIYDAWNKGLAKARGEWIAFIGADDQLLPDALQTYMEHINQHPDRHELEFVSSRIELVDNMLLPIDTVGEAWSWARFKHQMITWHVGAFHAKQLFSRYGTFDSNFKISGDYELLLRPKGQLKTSFIDQPTVKMRLGGISNRSLFRASEETYQAKIQNGVLSVIQGRTLLMIDKFRLLVRQLTGWKNF